MRQETRNIYQFSELSPEAQEYAIEHEREHIAYNGEITWQGEIFDSFKAVFETAGITIKDYSLSMEAYRNNLKIRFNNEEAEGLNGPRAMAWLENNLFSKLRMPWQGKRRNDTRKYGKAYWPNYIPPCPLTGYCADENYLDELKKDIKSGMTLKDSFMDMVNVYSRLVENEYEYQTSDEGIKETIEANESEFDENGHMI